MDLKEVIGIVRGSSRAALTAFSEEKNDIAEQYLTAIMIEIGKYLDEKTTPAGDVTESATSEKPAETLEETQAKVSGPRVHPGVIDTDAAARQIGQGQADEKQTQ